VNRRGFTLLEVVVALAILGLALLAIFDLNAGAVNSHAYAKRLTVATMLARSKMTDLEQDLYDKGFDADDQERSGDFKGEGWEAAGAQISPPLHRSSCKLIEARLPAGPTG
jgi:general secretion pathway protein I